MPDDEDVCWHREFAARWLREIAPLTRTRDHLDYTEAELREWGYDPADFPGFTHEQIIAGLAVPACEEIKL